MKRAPVGAHYGLKDWLIQRVTAVAMLAYTLLVVIALPHGPLTFESWRGLFAPQWMRVATFVLAASVLIHAWIGMRNILMDYVKPVALRLSLQAAVALALAGYAGWAMQILWRF